MNRRLPVVPPRICLRTRNGKKSGADERHDHVAGEDRGGPDIGGLDVTDPLAVVGGGRRRRRLRRRRSAPGREVTADLQGDGRPVDVPRDEDGGVRRPVEAVIEVGDVAGRDELDDVLVVGGQPVRMLFEENGEQLPPAEDLGVLLALVELPEGRPADGAELALAERRFERDEAEDVDGPVEVFREDVHGQDRVIHEDGGLELGPEGFDHVLDVVGRELSGAPADHAGRQGGHARAVRAASRLRRPG